MELRLGLMVRDRATSFEGYLSSMHEVLGGLVQWGIQPVITDPAKMELGDSKLFDGFLLEVTGNGVVEHVPAPDTTCTFVLGDKLRDRVTGLEGIMTEKVTFLNGCVYVCIRGKQPSENAQRWEAPKSFATHPRFEKVSDGLNSAQQEERPKKRRETGGPIRSMSNIGD